MVASRNRDAGTVFNEMGSLLWLFATPVVNLRTVVSRTELPYERRSCTRDTIPTRLTMTTINNQNNYGNSRPMYTNYWSGAKEVDNLVGHISSVIGYKNPTQKIHIKVILLNLYVNNSSDKTMYVGLSRDAHRNIAPRSRYNRLGIAAESVAQIVDALLAHELLTCDLGWEDLRTKKRVRSKIRSTDKLLLLFREYKLSPAMVTKFTEDELIIVRAKPDEGPRKKIDDRQRKKIDEGHKYLDYKNNRLADNMRAFLRRYNEFLFNTYIDVDEFGYENKSDSELSIDLANKRVRRIFNDLKFKAGGRFFGGWWQNIPEDLRARIIIDRFYTAEYDYSGYHIYLLYAKEGINFRNLHKDAYIYPKSNDPHKLRIIYKHLLLCAINAEDRKSCLLATHQEIRKGRKRNKDKYPEEIPNLGDLLNSFKDYHQPIAKYFDFDEGVGPFGPSLQNLDSMIAEDVLVAMTRESLPCLCVHDSFICRVIDGAFLQEVMKKAYLKHLPEGPWKGIFGNIPIADIEIKEPAPLSDKPLFMHDDDILFDVISRPESGIYGRLFKYLETENPHVDKVITIPKRDV